MYKKTISIVLFIAILSFSCGTMRQSNRDKVHSLEGKKIIGVVKTSGEEIIFPKESSGWFEGDRISGKARKDTTDVINYKDIDQIINGVIITKDGKSYLQSDYHHFRYDEEAGNYFLNKTIDYSVSIPISEVKEVIVFSQSAGASRGAGTGFLVGAGACLLLGLVSYDPNSIDAREWGVLPIVIGTLICGVFGLLIGLIVGASDGTAVTYQINESNETKTENIGE